MPERGRDEPKPLQHCAYSARSAFHLRSIDTVDSACMSGGAARALADAPGVLHLHCACTSETALVSACAQSEDAHFRSLAQKIGALGDEGTSAGWVSRALIENA